MKPARSMVAWALGVLACAVPARAEATEACIEVSDTVGEHVCSRFGDGWSVERKLPVVFRFGLRYAQVGTQGLGFVETFRKKERPEGYRGYRFAGETLDVGSLAGFGGDGGFTFHVAGQLYAGLEGGLALGSTKTASFSTGNHALSDARGVDVALFHGGLPVGYRIPLGRASLRGEVLLGGTVVSVTQRNVVGGHREDDTASVAGRWLVEPRVAGDIWFTQHVTFGAYAGANVLDSRGHAFGLSLAWHYRAFDGDMSLW